MKAIREAARRDAALVESSRKLQALLATVVFPFITSVIASNPMGLVEQGGAFHLAGTAVSLSLWVLFARLTILSASSVQAIYFAAREIEEQHERDHGRAERLATQIEYHSLVNTFSRAWLVMLGSIPSEACEAGCDVDEMASDILQPMVETCEDLFQIGPGEMWNFVLYLHDGARLNQVWRRKHAKHPGSAIGRSWEPGQGHVGKAFADKQAKITADASIPAVQELMKPPEPLRRDYDSAVYRSFACIPVSRPQNDSSPWGVLVATSDRAGRFDENNAEILRQAAAALASALSLKGHTRQ